MAGVIRPPYGAPTGPRFADRTLVDGFISGMRTGYSRRYHIEGDVLLIDRMEPVVIRVSPATFLLSSLHSDQLTRWNDWGHLVRTNPPLATVVALQAVGEPSLAWDLWSRHPGDALHELARVAGGGEVRDP
ncbi:MAG: hypothetical protein ACLGHX_09635 [Acidimicrobiia bacterium]